MESTLITVFMVILIMTYFLHPVQIVGNSMKNTLQPDDQVFMSTVFFDLSYGDIVVIDNDCAYLMSDSKNVVKFVKQMDSEGRFNFDMFLFNCGLHDLKRNKPDRALQVSISDYESNLREVIAICKKNNVPVVFVNITPILDTRYGEDAEFIRKNEDVIAYNAVAEKVMKENDVPVIDLNGYTLSLGQLSTTMRDHAHYYVDVQQKQAQYIADYIMK